ncbi:hypothetical protein ACFX5K_02450 [Rickettsiales bacterium LUAb2]
MSLWLNKRYLSIFSCLFLLSFFMLYSKAFAADELQTNNAATQDQVSATVTPSSSTNANATNSTNDQNSATSTPNNTQSDNVNSVSESNDTVNLDSNSIDNTVGQPNNVVDNNSQTNSDGSEYSQYNVQGSKTKLPTANQSDSTINVSDNDSEDEDYAIPMNSIAKIEKRNYAYLQLGAGMDFTEFFASITSYDTQAKKYKTSDYHLLGYADINPSAVFGFYLVNHDLAIELEYGTLTEYEKRINGAKIDASSTTKAYVTMQYATINVKKNLFTFWGNNIFFVDGGLGAGIVMTTTDQQPENKPEPVVQLGFGMYHHINDHFDIGLEYKYRTNIATKAQLASGNRVLYWLQVHTIVASIKFKI